MTDVGEVEIFDGAAWKPLASLTADPDSGDRRAEGPQQDPGDAGDTVSSP